MHGLGIQRLVHLPRAVRVQGQRRAAVGDAVDVAAPKAGEARVPVIGHHAAIGHRDGIGLQVIVHRLHQAERGDVFRHIHMGAHVQRVDARIGASGGEHHHGLAGDPGDGFLDGLLDWGRGIAVAGP
jgi:hypothetical protein